jgi:transcriptional regulator with XRE-family HTH domain
MKEGDIMLEIGERIRQCRERIGMTQDELAQATGYKSRSSINKIEKGGNDLPQSKIVIFAKALSTTPSYLMGWEDNNNEDDSSEILKKEKPAMTSRQNRIIELFDKLTTEQQDNIIGRAELLVEQNEEEYKKKDCG